MTQSTPEVWEGHTLTIDHTFNAPRALVWDAWTKPEHLAEWWGPDHLIIPRVEFDVRPGGAIHIDMLGPDGVTHPMAGTMREVVPQERLVFESGALDSDGNSMFDIHFTATFSGDGDVTHVTLEARVISTTPVAGQYLQGMEMGWTQSLAKLERFLARN